MTKIQILSFAFFAVVRDPTSIFNVKDLNGRYC
jgi:hypothetical protein